VPDVSTLNYVTGEAATNLATIELGIDRRVCIVSSVRTNVIVDVFAVMTAPPGSPVERLTFDKPAWPPFNAAATDYVIECGAGTTAAGGTSSVAMSIDLLPFTTATLSVAGGPPAPVGTGTTRFILATDQPVVLATTREGVARNYHFRCVPTDFPRLEVVRPGNPSAGWYLTTSGFASLNPVLNGPFVMILDHYGAPVWYKRTPASQGLPAAMMDFKRLSDGRLAFTPAYGPFGIDADQGYWLTSLQGTGTVKHRTVDGRLTDHHDYIELPPAKYGSNARAQISYPIRTDGALPFGSPSDTYSDGVIQEIDGAGNLLWEWEMHRHFEPASSTFPLNFESTPRFGGTGWDVFHINAIDRVSSNVPADDGDYIVTVRHMDGVFRIDHPSGNVRWTLGTPAPIAGGSKQLAIVGDPYNGPKRPHDARLNGNILTMFDNQAGMPGRQSRAVAYEINESAGTATMLWEIRNAAPFTGDTLGSVQQTGDSVVVNWGAGLQPFLEEFTTSGTRLMAVGLPNSGNSYRTIKYPPTDFDINQLRSTAGGAVTPP
jgi:hypothetical protein